MASAIGHRPGRPGATSRRPPEEDPGHARGGRPAGRAALPFRRMRPGRPGWTEVLAAAGSGGWAAAFLVPDARAVTAVAPLCAASVLVCRRAPLTAGALVVAAEVAQWWLGVPSENPASIVTGLLTTFCLGRYRADPAGTALVMALALVMAGRDGFAVPTPLFVAVLLCAVWTAGRLVGRRAARAAAAEAETAELQRADPAALATRLVAEERARLAGETLGVVRAAVTTMQREIPPAGSTPDPTRCAAVQQHGRRAVAELRRLLGLLRSEQPAPLVDVRAASPPLVRRAPWPVDVLIAAGIAAMVVAEWATVDAHRPWPAVALTLALCAALGLLRAAPALSTLLAAVPVAAALVIGEPLIHGLERRGGRPARLGRGQRRPSPGLGGPGRLGAPRPGGGPAGRAGQRADRARQHRRGRRPRSPLERPPGAGTGGPGCRRGDARPAGGARGAGRAGGAAAAGPRAARRGQPRDRGHGDARSGRGGAVRAGPRGRGGVARRRPDRGRPGPGRARGPVRSARRGGPSVRPGWPPRPPHRICPGGCAHWSTACARPASTSRSRSAGT